MADYVQSAFEDSGYSPFVGIQLVDARHEQSYGGGVHCATNAIRTLPNTQWWVVQADFEATDPDDASGQ
jgi:hypothetical protein